MDVVLFKGTLQNAEISFGLLTKKKVLAFEKGGKYLFPKDKSSKVIELPEEIDLAKIKKTTKETDKALEIYLNHRDLVATTFGGLLIEYYIKEKVNLETLLEGLDEEGKNFIQPIYDQILKVAFYKRGATFPDYFKEAKVITRYAMMDLELVFGTLVKDFGSFLFKESKPVSIFPLRYSTREITEEDLDKMEELHAKKIEQWLKWRKVLRKSEFIYNFMIHWVFQVLEKLYPEDQEAIKETIEDAERIELFSNPDVLTAIQTGQDFEAEDFAQVSMNKHLLYYYSMQYTFDEKVLSFKKYKQTPSFGYQDIFISMANFYASMPLFSNFNPLFSMITGGLIEWIDQNLIFQAMRGNQQMDPYNIIPNALTFILSVVGSQTKKLKEKKYILIKTIQKLLTPEKLKEGLSWVKQSQIAFQGKDPEKFSTEVTDEEVTEKLKEIAEKAKEYIKELKVAPVKKKEFNLLIDELAIVDKTYEEMKDSRDKYLLVDAKYKKKLTDFQKDFILSLQLFEKDKEILNEIAKLFEFFNHYTIVGNTTALFGFAIMLWMITISKQGSLEWLKIEEPTSIKPKEESKTLARICIRYNTILQGFLIKGYPLIETTAPTTIIQATQNLSELLLAKDTAKEKKHPIYSEMLKNLKSIYS
ncbi:MAG: hypothetical protein GOP50_01465 [Candidatus Heimdallarchaeota archaeon]|nr:hypothetical protein [Candidatus Heimdallarchaeota archaeon]